jgi:hypothetical protein
MGQHTNLFNINMPSSNHFLVSNGGTQGIIPDSTAPSSASDVMQIHNDLQILNEGITPIKNCAIICTVISNNPFLIFTLRSQDKEADDATTSYQFRIESGSGASIGTLKFQRNNSGSQTILLSDTTKSVPTGTVTTWQIWKFSVKNLVGNVGVILRAAVWNGSSFTTLADFTDTSSSRITNAGKPRFGLLQGTASFDNVKILSLS